LLDLEAQHEPIRAELERAAARVIASGRFILGEEVAAFERALAAELGVAHAVGVSSGSDALLASLMAYGVGPGDEVITTPYSFFATVEAIVRLGARPIFADIEPTTMNLDPDLAAARIGGATKAVVVVHLFGRLARTGPLAEACARAGTPIIEDAAQAISAWRVDETTGQRLSIATAGQVAALSFFPTKNLGGFGDGGMVATNDGPLAARVRSLRSHGASGRHHHVSVGGNFRLDELQAALLRIKLRQLPSWTAARRRLAARYRDALAGLPIRLPPDEPGCVWNQFVVAIPDGRRDALVEHLAGAGIASAVYYPTPLHLQPALAFLGYRAGDFPLAERAATEALALPLFPELGDDGVQAVTRAVAAFFR
jgi:dTDP-4-amino-4,6-dideoxygalactose transaminase